MLMYQAGAGSPRSSTALAAASFPQDLPIPAPASPAGGGRAAGRAALLDGTVPLLTLTGPGGAGQTPVALAVAADLEGRFADEVAWIDVSPLGDPAQDPATVATALGVVPLPGRDVTGQIARRLRPMQALVLLDNYEHLLAAATDLVAALLAECPALQVLATSRAPIRIRGERVLPLAPFPLPPPSAPPRHVAENDAVRLFAERARAVRPSFALDDLIAAALAALRDAGRAPPIADAVARALAVDLGAPPAPPPAPASAPFGLTPRQQEILALLCARLTDPEIAERLFLSPRTVEGHVAQILGKLGVENRRQAAALAARLALVRLPAPGDPPRIA